MKGIFDRKKERALTQDMLKELLYYLPSTGEFKWKKTLRKNRIVGDVAGHGVNGYRAICINGKVYMSHRLAYLYMEGYFPEHSIDHINWDKSDNRWSNLREATTKCNLINRGLQKNNTSGIVGVTYHNNTKKWKAQIQVNRKNIGLGYHNTKLQAAVERLRAEVRYNFMSCIAESTALIYVRKSMS